MPRLLAISDRRLLGARPFEEWLDALAAAEVDAVQIREKDLPDREVLDLARRARARLPGRVAVLVNGRLDIAMAAGCQGVHLPASGLPADALRAWARQRGVEVVIGRSTHGAEEILRAREEGVDYVAFGPVFPTPSKARHGPPLGLEGLRAASALGVPVVALGGVGAEGARAAAEAGAAGFAGIRAFHDPRSLQALREALPAATESSFRG